MKDFVRLVMEWDAYYESHPKSSLEDFLRYMLGKSRYQDQEGKFQELCEPMDTDGQLMKVIGRMSGAFHLYLRVAVRDTPLKSSDQFIFLSSLRLLGETNKTEVINYAMMEMSTGSDILRRLLKKGYLTERVDPNDKRSRLIQVTEEGNTILQQCYQKVGKIPEMMLNGLTQEDKMLIIQLLSPLQEKHDKLAVESKAKTIEEIYDEQIKKTHKSIR